MQIIELDEIELGLIVNLEIFREVLRELSTGGARCWVASDPVDALETGSLTIGHGYPGCEDRLNATYFRIPILNEELPRRGTSRLVLLIAPSVIEADDPGFRMDDGQPSVTDILNDSKSFSRL